MARYEMTVTTHPADYATATSSAALPVTWNAGRTSGMQFSHTGREEILVRASTTSTAGIVTMVSSVDALGRTKNKARNLAAGANPRDVFTFGRIPLVGFTQAGSKCHINVTSTKAQIAVVRHPTNVT